MTPAKLLSQIHIFQENETKLLQKENVICYCYEPQKEWVDWVDVRNA